MSQLLTPDPAILGGIIAFENLPPDVLAWLLMTYLSLFFLAILLAWLLLVLN